MLSVYILLMTVASILIPDLCDFTGRMAPCKNGGECIKLDPDTDELQRLYRCDCPTNFTKPIRYWNDCDLDMSCECRKGYTKLSIAPGSIKDVARTAGVEKEGGCFMTGNDKMTFDDAKAFCENQPGGATLAYFDTVDQVFDIEYAGGIASTTYWIGMKKKEGKYVYNYTNKALKVGEAMRIFPTSKERKAAANKSLGHDPPDYNTMPDGTCVVVKAVENTDDWTIFFNPKGCNNETYPMCRASCSAIPTCNYCPNDKYDDTFDTGTCMVKLSKMTETTGISSCDEMDWYGYKGRRSSWNSMKNGQDDPNCDVGDVSKQMCKRGEGLFNFQDAQKTDNTPHKVKLCQQTFNRIKKGVQTEYWNVDNVCPTKKSEFPAIFDGITDPQAQEMDIKSQFEDAGCCKENCACQGAGGTFQPNNRFFLNNKCVYAKAPGQANCTTGIYGMEKAAFNATLGLCELPEGTPCENIALQQNQVRSALVTKTFDGIMGPATCAEAVIKGLSFFGCPHKMKTQVGFVTIFQKQCCGTPKPKVEVPPGPPMPTQTVEKEVTVSVNGSDIEAAKLEIQESLKQSLGLQNVSVTAVTTGERDLEQSETKFVVSMETDNTKGVAKTADDGDFMSEVNKDLEKKGVKITNSSQSVAICPTYLDYTMDSCKGFTRILYNAFRSEHPDPKEILTPQKALDIWTADNETVDMGGASCGWMDCTKLMKDNGLYYKEFVETNMNFSDRVVRFHNAYRYRYGRPDIKWNNEWGPGEGICFDKPELHILTGNVDTACNQGGVISYVGKDLKHAFEHVTKNGFCQYIRSELPGDDYTGFKALLDIDKQKNDKNKDFMKAMLNADEVACSFVHSGEGCAEKESWSFVKCNYVFYGGKTCYLPSAHCAAFRRGAADVQVNAACAHAYDLDVKYKLKMEANNVTDFAALKTKFAELLKIDVSQIGEFPDVNENKNVSILFPDNDIDQMNFVKKALRKVALDEEENLEKQLNNAIADGGAVTLDVDPPPKECKLPASLEQGIFPTGYARYDALVPIQFDGCTTNDCSQPFVLGLKCAQGFAGQVNTTECDFDNLEVELSGCQVAVQCTLPVSQAGFVLTNAALSQCDNGDCSNASITGVTCASGYQLSKDGIQVNGCNKFETQVSITGCLQACRLPQVAPTGYRYTEGASISNCLPGDKDMCKDKTDPDGYNITGVECWPHYVYEDEVNKIFTDVTVGGCSEANLEIKLRGCVLNDACKDQSCGTCVLDEICFPEGQYDYKGCIGRNFTWCGDAPAPVRSPTYGPMKESYYYSDTDLDPEDYYSEDYYKRELRKLELEF